MQKARRNYKKRTRGARPRRIELAAPPFTQILQIKSAYWRTSGRSR